MLSMAVVPVNNKIDPSAGEAFAVDFSVIETEEPLDNWLFQVVQHAANGGYYVVRQLEGFSPVYHQIVWNGRKGIIGPELACGTYTLALTARDVLGGKRTIRRQIEVACKNLSADKKEVSAETDKNLDYKTARLWNKPARIMKSAPVTSEPEMVDPLADSASAGVAAPAAGTADPYAAYGAQQPAAGVSNPYAAPAAGTSDPYAAYGAQQPAAGVSNPYAAPAAATANPYAAPATGTQPSAQGVTNPYDMPYEEYGAQ